MTYDFHTGLTSYEAAIDAARSSLSDDEISLCENPQVKPYFVVNKEGRRIMRWKITLEH